MKTTYRLDSRCHRTPKRPPVWSLLPMLFLGIAIVGCDSASLDTGPHDAVTGTPTSISASLQALDFVEQVTMTVQQNSPAKEDINTLHITLKPDVAIRYPKAFRILGMSESGNAITMRDDGQGGDAYEGDYTYSARVDRSCLESGLPATLAGKDILSFTLTCDFDFISPGESCAGHGICEETASRSFLWGLIEYDVDVVTCWCFLGCEAEFEVKI